MSLANIKKLQAEKGFTIVELLIVIVVIGILAAIVIVAYNGIQNRANTTAKNTAAENLAKKIEAYNAVKSSYPAYSTTAGALKTALDSVSDSSTQGSGINLLTAAPTASSGNSDVAVKLCVANGTIAAGNTPVGYVIYIWDSTQGTPQAVPVQAGGTFTINSSTTPNTTNPVATGTNCAFAS